jgi:hypothetical protein
VVVTGAGELCSCHTLLLTACCIRPLLPLPPLAAPVDVERFVLDVHVDAAVCGFICG